MVLAFSFNISGRLIKIGKWSVMLFLIIPEVFLILAFRNILSIRDSVVNDSPFALVFVEIRVGSVIVETR